MEYNLGNNIAVDPNIVCHTEQSEVSILNAVFRSFTFVQDDKFAKKKVAGQLLYYYYNLWVISDSIIGRVVPNITH